MRRFAPVVRGMLLISTLTVFGGTGLKPAKASTCNTPALEQKMLQMVNGERSRAGLAPLVPDSSLAGVARSHSRDMASHNFFSHTSPSAGSAQDRLSRAGIPIGGFGENLAYASSLQEAHSSLMKSAPHREHILADRFDRVGIGISVGASGTIYVTQEFHTTRAGVGLHAVEPEFRWANTGDRPLMPASRVFAARPRGLSADQMGVAWPQYR